jgi:hypothetical protein
MKKVAKIAVAAAVALVLGTSMAALADDATPPPPKAQVSAAAGKDLQAAQKALTAQKYEEVLAALEKVKNNPKKNDYDEYVMNEFYVSTYAGQKKLQEAVGPLEAVMESKFMPAEELKRRVVQAAYLNYELKNYDKTIQYGSRAVKDGYAPAQLQTAIAQAYYLKNDYKGTDHFVRGMVDDEIKAGQAPSEDILELGLSSAAKQNDEAAESRWLELMVSYHPKPEYWENLLDTLYHNKLTDKQTLQVYRLSSDVGALKRGSDYAEMAQLALDAGSPGEAVSVLNKGFAANVFTEPADKNRNTHLLDSAKKQAAADQPTLAKSEATANSAATGDALVGVGVGYFGYGDYAKATADISAGLAKGTSKDATDARLLLGIAQLKGGDKDSAVKTFKTVKGDPVTERLAALWILRAKT